MKLKQLPNFLTAIRFISIPILWFLAVYQQKTIFTIIFIIAASTDIFDGFAARKLKAQSKFGAKFDTISDDLMTVSAIAWIYFLMPEILTENTIPLLVLLAFFIIDYAVRIIKHKKIELPFHTILDKIGALTGFLFLSHALIFNYSQIFLYILIIIGSLMAVEETILLLTRKRITENTKSILIR